MFIYKSVFIKKLYNMAFFLANRILKTSFDHLPKLDPISNESCHFQITHL